MTVIEQLNLKELYEIDDYLWIQETVKLLKEKKFNELDLENLIEELEELSRRDKDTIYSYLELIICHLLYLEFWLTESEYNAHHWQGEIANFRNRLERRLTNNLRNFVEKDLEKIYQTSLRVAIRKTNNSYTFPASCPYTLAQLLDHNWFPMEIDN